ncbi:MAG: DUF4230 domain-containing protein [Beduini sp.]|uniref:DUF4230 domain-containing protein n=1 Tax=Beduini sp. TaxID=1922300 RepID=UPI0039A21B3D
MKKYMKTIKQIVFVVIVAAISLTIGSFIGGKQSKPEITSDLITQQLRSASELTTLEYLYTNIGKFENNIDFNGWNIPLTTKEFVLSYDGVIKAGIDLEALEVKVEGQKIVVTLPQATITSHVIDEKSIQLFNESKNIFNQISVQDYVDFTKVLKEEKELDLETKGLLEQAQEKSKEVLTTLIDTLTDHEYTIEFTA